MRGLDWLMARLQRPREASVAPASTTPARAPLAGLMDAVLARASASPSRLAQVFLPPQYAPGVAPAAGLATDSAIDARAAYANALVGGDAVGFLGYPLLAEMTQRPEYRKISEIIAGEMTREWIKLEATGEDDKTQKLNRLRDLLEEFNVQDSFRRAAEFDGFFGLAQIFIDLGQDDSNGGELQTPLVIDPRKIKRGSLRAFTVLDPTWVAPTAYNSANPLSRDFYKPRAWFVMGNQVHASRLLSFVSREVPDLLKPAYNFGGISMTQIARPYVENWIRTRQSVSDLLHSFTVWIYSGDLNAMLASPDGTGGDLLKRLDMFNRFRDNRGLFVMDKATETLANISVPLGTLDHLQAQAQEQIASVASIPLVKLLGVTPSGLNASSDGEIKVFYDSIKAMQERLFTKPLRTVLDVLQLHEWGEIDPEIRFSYVPLWQMSEAERATMEKTKADTEAVLVEIGALGPEEVRKRIATQESSAYPGLDLTDMPEPTDDEGDVALPFGLNAGDIAGSDLVA